MSALPITVATERQAFFTPKTLAAYLAVSERTIRQMLADEVIESYKIAGSRRIDPADVADYLSRCRVGRTVDVDIKRAGDAANAPAPAQEE
jgi:excisionase family DNA binding protein